MQMYFVLKNASLRVLRGEWVRWSKIELAAETTLLVRNHVVSLKGDGDDSLGCHGS